MSTRSLYAALCSAVALGLVSMPTQAALNEPTTEDFVTKATVASQFEIRSSQLALQKSRNPNVQSFAERMVGDHTQNIQRLKGTLQSYRVNAAPATDLDEEHQEMLNRLESASGEAFDRQYIALQTEAHHNAVDLFRDYSEQGANPALREYAAETLPTLQAHLYHVQDLKHSAR